MLGFYFIFYASMYIFNNLLNDEPIALGSAVWHPNEANLKHLNHVRNLCFGYSQKCVALTTFYFLTF